jgi:hypothetical protein
MHSKSSKWDSEEIIDTRRLQIYSLCQFMQGLGYEYCNGNRLWGCPHFYSDQYSNKGRSTIGFTKAIDLYNNNSIKCIFGHLTSKLTLWSFNDYDVAKARAARIVTKVKLQLCKSTKTIICQDHRVNFVLPSFKNLFLNNKYI